MKIAFTNVDFKSFTGPNQFSFKLATQFEAMGHDISNGLTDEDTDIEELQRVNREEVEELAREYASSKPIGY